MHLLLLLLEHALLGVRRRVRHLLVREDTDGVPDAVEQVDVVGAVGPLCRLKDEGV